MVGVEADVLCYPHRRPEPYPSWRTQVDFHEIDANEQARSYMINSQFITPRVHARDAVVQVLCANGFLVGAGRLRVA